MVEDKINIAGRTERDLMGGRYDMGRPRIYIAGPIKLDLYRGVQQAIKAANFVIASGGVPFVPHLNVLWQLIDSDMEPDDYIEMYDIPWLLQCHALWRLPGKSRGADREVNVARSHKLYILVSENDVVHFIRSRPTA